MSDEFLPHVWTQATHEHCPLGGPTLPLRLAGLRGKFSKDRHRPRANPFDLRWRISPVNCWTTTNGLTWVSGNSSVTSRAVRRHSWRGSVSIHINSSTQSHTYARGPSAAIGMALIASLRHIWTDTKTFGPSTVQSLDVFTAFTADPYWMHIFGMCTELVHRGRCRPHPWV